MKRFSFLSIVFLGGLTQSDIANALDVTRQERSLLPRYCHYVQTPGLGNEETWNWSPEAKKYIARWGAQNQGHLHHYCWARVKYTRSLKPNLTIAQRNALRESSIDELVYSIDHSTQDFELLPELHTMKGLLFGLLGKPVKAEEALNTALALNPAYVPAYVEFVALYGSTGNKAAEAAIRKKASENGVAIPIVK
jgi:hypothetical protein